MHHTLLNSEVLSQSVHTPTCSRGGHHLPERTHLAR